MLCALLDEFSISFLDWKKKPCSRILVVHDKFVEKELRIIVVKSVRCGF